MGRIRDFFQARDKPKDRTAGSAWRFYYGQSTSNKLVTERSSMQVAAVYACVRVLSEAVAQLPLHLYRYTGDGSKERAVPENRKALLCLISERNGTQIRKSMCVSINRQV